MVMAMEKRKDEMMELRMESTMALMLMVLPKEASSD